MDKSKRVVVTGGDGFLGKRLVALLKSKGYENVLVVHHRDFDLVNMSDVIRMYDSMRPDVVIHLAAVVGGIGANKANPGEFFYKNLMMGVQLIEQGRLKGLEKFVAIGTICAYPKFTPVPFKESDLWNGYPEETNAPYGLAKKMLLVQSQAYRDQYGFNSIYLLPVNLYGPNDNFNESSSHVIPALIRKCVEAKKMGKESIVCWGTGNATREFLYVDDSAEAIVMATEDYNGKDPVNIGNGVEFKICDVLEMIRKEVGYSGEVVWDISKPDGQPRRCVDAGLSERLFGFKAKTSLQDGLRRTIEWYMLKSDV